MIVNTLVFTNGDTSITTPDPLVSTWTSASGIQITVRTYKASADQSDAEWTAAHGRHFQTMWAAFPPPE